MRSRPLEFFWRPPGRRALRLKTTGLNRLKPNICKIVRFVEFESYEYQHKYERKFSEHNNISMGIASECPPCLRAFAPIFQWTGNEVAYIGSNHAKLPT